jgi:hypothetical protein
MVTSYVLALALALEEPERVARSIIVLAPSRAAAKKVQAKYEFGKETIVSLQKKLPEDKYVVQPYGSNGAVVIDLDLWALKINRDVAIVAKGITRVANKDHVIRFGDFSAEEQSSLAAMIDSNDPGRTFSQLSATQKNDLKMQITGQLMMWPAKMSDGTTDYPFPSPAVDFDKQGSTRLQRRQEPFARDSKELKEFLDRADSNAESVVVTLGFASNRTGEAIRALGEAFKGVEEKLRKKATDALTELYKKLGINGLGALPSNASFDELPADVQDKLRQLWKADPSPFQTAADKEASIRNKGQFTITSEFYLVIPGGKYTVPGSRPGDPDRIFSRRYMQHIGRVSGGIGP